MVYSYKDGSCIGKNYFQGATWKTLMKHLAVRKRDGELRYGKVINPDYVDIYTLDKDHKEVLVKERMTNFTRLSMA